MKAPGIHLLLLLLLHHIHLCVACNGGGGGIEDMVKQSSHRKDDRKSGSYRIPFENPYEVREIVHLLTAYERDPRTHLHHPNVCHELPKDKHHEHDHHHHLSVTFKIREWRWLRFDAKRCSACVCNLLRYMTSRQVDVHISLDDVKWEYWTLSAEQVIFLNGSNILQERDWGMPDIGWKLDWEASSTRDVVVTCILSSLSWTEVPKKPSASSTHDKEWKECTLRNWTSITDKVIGRTFQGGGATYWDQWIVLRKHDEETPIQAPHGIISKLESDLNTSFARSIPALKRSQSTYVVGERWAIVRCVNVDMILQANIYPPLLECVPRYCNDTAIQDKNVWRFVKWARYNDNTSTELEGYWRWQECFF